MEPQYEWTFFELLTPEQEEYERNRRLQQYQHQHKTINGKGIVGSLVSKHKKRRK